MCGFIRVLGVGGMGRFPHWSEAPFQHHRDVVVDLVPQIGVGEVEVGAGLVRFLGRQSRLLLRACRGGLDALFRYYPSAVLADSDCIGGKHLAGVLGYRLDSSNHTSFKWNF